jgi:hypothetical protein
MSEATAKMGKRAMSEVAIFMFDLLVVTTVLIAKSKRKVS